VVKKNLEAFLGFQEGKGKTSADLTGNGHHATLSGASWGKGYAHVDTGSGRILVATGAAMLSPSFTYDLWFEAGSTSGSGRLLAQAQKVGGKGPDVLERSQRVAMRINNQGSTFNVPTVGTRSNSKPPDHYGKSADKFHKNSGPEHLIITHDAKARIVRMFLGLKGQPIMLTFQATYNGAYQVDTGSLGLGNVPKSDRVFKAKYYQFAYYKRPLTFSVNGARQVTSGEVLTNHVAGPNAKIPGPGPPDSGPAKDTAAPPVDAAGRDRSAVDARPNTPADAGGSSSGEIESGCACKAGPGDQGSSLRSSPVPWFFLLACFLSLIRRSAQGRNHPSPRRPGTECLRSEHGDPGYTRTTCIEFPSSG